MANKQIYELTTRTFDGDSLLPISVENPDSSTATEYPQLAGKTSGNALSDFVANSQQYATDLDTESKTITGAINELHSSIGANTYNTSSTYNKGDIVIYNGTLYACKDNSVTGAWDATKWDATTLQPKTDNSLATTDKTVVGAINELKSGKQDSITFYTRTNISQPVGTSYWSISVPPKTGYSRFVIGANPSTAELEYIRFVEDGNNIRIYMNNSSTSSVTYDLTIAVVYKPN